MKPIFKWILGIVLGLLVITALVALAVFGHGWFGRGDFFGRQGGELGQHMGIMGRGFGLMNSPLGWLGFISMGLIRLGGLVLLIVGIVWLVNRFNHHTRLTPVTLPSTPVRTCSNCSKPVQVDWSVCPYCGSNLSENKT